MPETATRRLCFCPYAKCNLYCNLAKPIVLLRFLFSFPDFHLPATPVTPGHPQFWYLSQLPLKQRKSAAVLKLCLKNTHTCVQNPALVLVQVHNVLVSGFQADKDKIANRLERRVQQYLCKAFQVLFPTGGRHLL